MLGSKLINEENTDKESITPITKEVEQNKTKGSIDEIKEENKKSELDLKQISPEEVKERKSEEGRLLSARVELKQKLETSSTSDKYIKKKPLDPNVKKNFREEVSKKIQSLGIKTNPNSEEYINEVNKGLSNIMENNGSSLINV